MLTGRNATACVYGQTLTAFVDWLNCGRMLTSQTVAACFDQSDCGQMF